MKLFISLLSLFLFTQNICAQEIIHLYPENKIPNQNKQVVKDSIENDRYLQIETPRMAVYTTSDDENKGAAVLIIPGGAYHHITHNMSGIQLAKWFNTMGMNAFVLYYRLPNQPNLVTREIAPLQDAQRAMQLIRANAAKWNIDANKIGVLGTSAGGHLAALLATQNDEITAINDSISAEAFKADFMILVSPVISMQTEISHKWSCINLLGENPPIELIQEYSCDKRVSPKTPRTFLVHADDDDAVPVRNSLLFYQALNKNKVSSSLHVFSHGKHRIAMRNNPGSTQYWTVLCEEWLNEIKVLE